MTGSGGEASSGAGAAELWGACGCTGISRGGEAWAAGSGGADVSAGGATAA